VNLLVELQRYKDLTTYIRSYYKMDKCYKCGKKIKSHIRYIFDPVFTQNYYIIKAKSLKEYHKILKDELNYTDVNDSSRCTGKFRVVEKAGQSIAVIWAMGDRVDILVHECLHAIRWSLQEKGIFLADGDEPYCYALQFLIKEALSNRIDKRVKIRTVL
jgi:hypothetical protein